MSTSNNDVYSVTITDSAGCSLQKSFNVSVPTIGATDFEYSSFAFDNYNLLSRILYSLQIYQQEIFVKSLGILVMGVQPYMKKIQFIPIPKKVFIPLHILWNMKLDVPMF